MTLDDYRAVGRLEAGGHAVGVMNEAARNTGTTLDEAQAVRVTLPRRRVADLLVSGASEEELAAYLTAADNRIYEAIAEIALEVRLSASEPPPSPPAGNRRERRAAKKMY